LESLAASARRAFDADDAVLSLEAGSAAPLFGVAHRGQSAICLSPEEYTGRDEVPRVRPGATTPWIEGEWLVAPVLERRETARGVLALRRSRGEFLDEEKEVLTLLAQMAATALSATELSREIEASETRLRILVDTAPAGIVEVDPGGRVRWWNRAASKIFAWPTFETADGSTPIFPETAQSELQKLWSDVLIGGPGERDLIDVEIRGRRRDLTSAAALLPTPDDQARSILMLVDDVTDHRQLKAEVHHAQQMEMRGRVASSVAHDFNNLLALISGYAEILSKDLASDVRSLDMVKDIQATTSRASMLTAQLQSIGRSQSLQPTLLDPVAVLQSNAEVLERIAGSKIEVTQAIDVESAVVLVDPGQFEQMMLNLTINARDAMPDGGRLRIGVESADVNESLSHELNVDAGNYVKISVADSGVGMSEETRLQCFEPFFTTKGALKGTGLGLAAARRLVEESGGSITCASALGAGTVFDIYLPISTDTIPEEPYATVEERPRGTATVLIAEDDLGLRQLMTRVLSRNGYHVLVATSGEEALEAAKTADAHIDLLVSDVVMLELAGPDLAKELQGHNNSLRVLLTSGTADASVLEGLLPGTSAFLAKPFRPSALIDQVYDLLSRR
jgi:PAS domain S-box-containing protein